MLIEFRITNFRSIRETQTFTLVAGSGDELEATNTFDPGITGFHRLVRSAVVYGPNAAGKTNLLRALQFMQTLVLNSAIASQQGTPIPHSPFKLAAETREAPSGFEITVAEDGVRYEYGFTVGPARFHNEWLLAYPHGRQQRLFERTYDEKSQTYEFSFSTKLRGSRTLWQDATRANALFLSTAVQLNSEQLLPVFQWFQKRLVVIASGIAPGIELNPTLTLKLLDQPEGKDKLLDLLRAADLGIADLAVRRESLPLSPGVPFFLPGVPFSRHAYLERIADSAVLNLVKVTSFHPAADSGEYVGLDMEEESQGTQILFRIAGAWLHVLTNGEVLLVDEIDTSLHPLMTRFLVGLFHSQSTNPKNAQLVFTTHDTSLLDTDVFRRDQVWFVEKTEQDSTHLYPLSDFSPRKQEALERGYLRGRYGALPIPGEVRS